MGRRIACSFVLAFAAAAAPAAAQPADAERQLFDQCHDLATAGKCAEARPRCERYLERSPHHAGVELGLAKCYAALDLPVLAWRMFDASARDFAESSDNVRVARDRRDALDGEVAIVIVRIASPAVPGMRVTIGDVTTAAADEVRTAVAPGDVEIVVAGPGRDTFRASVRVRAGASFAVEVPELARARVATDDRARDEAPRDAASDNAAPPASAPARRDPWKTRFVVAAVATGVFAIGYGVSWYELSTTGAYLAPFSYGRLCIIGMPNAPNQPGACAYGEALTTTMFVGGLATIATGALATIALVKWRTGRRRGVAALPFVGPNGGGAVVRVTW